MMRKYVYWVLGERGKSVDSQISFAMNLKLLYENSSFFKRGILCQVFHFSFVFNLISYFVPLGHLTNE